MARELRQNKLAGSLLWLVFLARGDDYKEENVAIDLYPNRSWVKSDPKSLKRKEREGQIVGDSYVRSCRCLIANLLFPRKWHASFFLVTVCVFFIVFLLRVGGVCQVDAWIGRWY
jgi:hypothetical protein